MTLPIEYSRAVRRWVLPGVVRLRLWISVGLLLAGFNAFAVQPYVHESWTVRDGLPVNSITQIVQARDGYLWLSTFDGLVRFDGARFQVHTSSNTPGLGHQRLVGVLETGDGQLLLSSDGGVLQLFDPNSERAQVLWTTPSGKAPLVWRRPDGEILISLEPGLGRLRGNRIVPMPIASLPQWQIISLGFAGDDRMWVGTANAGVWSLTTGRASAGSAATAERRSYLRARRGRRRHAVGRRRARHRPDRRSWRARIA